MIRFLQTSGAKQWILGVVIVLSCIGMVLYLIPGFLSNTGSVSDTGVYATVGEQQITATEIGQVAQQQGKQMFPNGFPEQFAGYLNKRAAEQLLTQAAVLHEAGKMGLSVSDNEVRNELLHGQYAEVFAPGGKFIGEEAYKNLLADHQMKVEDFERDVKHELLMRKLEAIVTNSVSVSPDEVKAQFLKDNTKVKFDYAVLNVADLAKQVTVSDAELKAFYEQHKDQYKDSIPEQRKARYVVISANDVPVQVTDQDLQKAYDERKMMYQVPEQVDVRHILISTQNGKHTDAEALKIAQDVEKQAKAGADFASLAKKYSDDPGSKDNGGLYKNVVRKQMVPEFDQAAFSLKPGEISDPVKTTFGYHILKVDAHRQAQTKPLEEVKPELEQAVKQEKAASQLDTIANNVVSEAHTAGLDSAASKNHLNVISTDYFTMTSQLPGIGSSQDFMQQVFQLRPKDPPEKVRLENGYAVVEVVDSKPARTPGFDEIRTQVEQQFRNTRARQMLAQKVQLLSDRAKAGHDLKAAAKEVGATIKTSEMVLPSGQVPDIGAMSGPAAVAFTMNKGEISGPLTLASGSGAVLQVTDKQEPSAADLAAKQDQVRDSLLQQKRTQMFNVYADSVTARLKKEGVIKTNPKVAAQLFGQAAG